jgi:hypothetical protein
MINSERIVKPEAQHEIANNDSEFEASAAPTPRASESESRTVHGPAQLARNRGTGLDQ